MLHAAMPCLSDRRPLHPCPSREGCTEQNRQTRGCKTNRSTQNRCESRSFGRRPVGQSNTGRGRRTRGPPFRTSTQPARCIQAQTTRPFSKKKKAQTTRPQQAKWPRCHAGLKRGARASSRDGWWRRRLASEPSRFSFFYCIELIDPERRTHGSVADSSRCSLDAVAANTGLCCPAACFV